MDRGARHCAGLVRGRLEAIGEVAYQDAGHGELHVLGYHGHDRERCSYDIWVIEIFHRLSSSNGLPR